MSAKSTASEAAVLDQRGVLASVLTPVLNEESYIHETAAAMTQQAVHGDVEFLFIDGRSTDRTKTILEDLAREDPRVRVLDNPARRTPGALNIGLREARGEYIVRMDAHTYYPPNYIARGIERLSAGDVDWVTGPQIPYGVGRWSRRVALALQHRLGTGGSSKWGNVNHPEVELDTGVFTGIWRRDVLERLGGWDEGWPVNQDAELAARMLEAGGRIVCLRDMAARYVPRDSLARLAQQYWRFGFYRAKTSRRHPSSMRRSHLLAPGLALTVFATAVSPRPLARLARLGLYAYVAMVTSAGWRAMPRAAVSEALTLPAVFATMHVAFGLGFLAGCLRFGPPLSALGGLARSSPSR